MIIQNQNETVWNVLAGNHFYSRIGKRDDVERFNRFREDWVKTFGKLSPARAERVKMWLWARLSKLESHSCRANRDCFQKKTKHSEFVITRRIQRFRGTCVSVWRRDCNLPQWTQNFLVTTSRKREVLEKLIWPSCFYETTWFQNLRAFQKLTWLLLKNFKHLTFDCFSSLIAVNAVDTLQCDKSHTNQPQISGSWFLLLLLRK